MAYSDAAKTPGRIPLVFVEVDVDRCSRTYGTAPCTAAIGTTGDRKCYNTYATCQDTAHYAKGTAYTYRFCEENAAVPVGIAAIPLLRDQGVSFAPQRITPGKGLGIRASVTVRLKDAPWPDTGIDQYLTTRTHDTSQGSFWGKFRARERFYEGRALRVRSGYVVSGEPFSWDNFQSRVYILDAVKGPGRDDGVELIAKDILKLADDKRALCPRPSKGQLAADITSTATTCTLTPAGIGAAEYPASGRVVIGGEGMAFTRSGDVLTLTRNVYGTGAKEHKADDTVQLVKRYESQEIQDVIRDLLVNYAGISASYIDLTAWTAERDTYLSGVWSTDLCEPTGVNTLIGELTEQGTCSVWWDEVAQKIQFRAARPPSVGLPERNDAGHFLQDSVTAGEDTGSRISQVLVHFGQIDPTAKLDETKNYRTHYFIEDPEDAGGANQHGSEALKKIFSRWFQVISLGRVQALANSLLATYRHPPRTLEADLDAADALGTGDLFYAKTRAMQDDTGAIATVNMQVIEAAEKRAGSVYSIKAQENVYTPPASGIVYLADAYNVDLYQAYITEYGAQSSAVTVQFVIPAGVVVGSTSTSTPALVNPTSWPAGSDVSVKNLGTISGMGGKGGGGAADDSIGNTYTAATAGSAGGTALYAYFPLTVDNASGVIQGGGGGGGGGDASATGWARANGYGGGGGAGSAGGDGGRGNGGSGGSPGSSAGTLSSGGAGGIGSTVTYSDGSAVNYAGGSGGNPGASGSAGSGPSPGAGGAAGKAVQGNSYITWTATGTRLGAIT